MEGFKADVSSASPSSQRKDKRLTLETSAKLTAFVQSGISHIEGCERELLRYMLYIFLETNNLISVIHFPFV